MEYKFRSSMTWLHTWSGLLLGWLLFAVFVTGTSSYYKDEITLWMKPEFHSSTVSKDTLDISIDKALDKIENSSSVSAVLPNSRSNLIAIKTQGSTTQQSTNTSAGHDHHHHHGDMPQVQTTKDTKSKDTKKQTQAKQVNNMKKRGRTPPNLL